MDSELERPGRIAPAKTDKKEKASQAEIFQGFHSISPFDPNQF
jgi:hypothetical protein